MTHHTGCPLRPVGEVLTVGTAINTSSRNDLAPFREHECDDRAARERELPYSATRRCTNMQDGTYLVHISDTTAIDHRMYQERENVSSVHQKHTKSCQCSRGVQHPGACTSTWHSYRRARNPRRNIDNKNLPTPVPRKKHRGFRRGGPPQNSVAANLVGHGAAVFRTYCSPYI